MTQSIAFVNASIFPCPSCGQMIYSDAEKCRFCSATVDHQAALEGAATQARVNDACSQAKLMRNSAGVMWIFFLLGLIPFLPLGWGFTGLFFAIPVWLVYWQLRFGSLKTGDADYKHAKRDRLIALVIWIPALALELFLVSVRLLIRS